MSTEYHEILYGVADRVATITLNVPEKRNCLSYRMRREIREALHTAENDDVVSVVLIRAAGPSFCSGYDISPPPAAGKNRDYYRDEDQRPQGWVSSPEFAGWTDQWARSCLRDLMHIWTLLKPVVALVHGDCLAGGTELMSLCDIAFVADDAVLGYPPMRGMSTPDVPFFPWKMTMAQAKYLQLTGNSVSGAEAARMGWVAKSFPPEELEEAVQRELRALSGIPVSLLSANKQSVNQAYDIMGMQTHFGQAWSWHLLSGSIRPDAREFGRILMESGLKAALEWRDGAFRREGFR
ncbi:enoyl-CoA hydratase-related protein [Amycolatopsis jejuensis]|uniref:enoyl-CoA hydratase-related protein n=1 Tax=Amycolatopsis jejuensis TaxID=330084 RepID=UPI0005263E2A|nr:enoyl-CoA hydratase-related protein [Amycolatopsis jejuensis]